jgi:hypothetical protein
MLSEKVNDRHKNKMANKESKNGWRKKPKNQMNNNVIGKSKYLAQNKNGWTKHAKKLLKLHKNAWIKNVGQQN